MFTKSEMLLIRDSLEENLAAMQSKIYDVEVTPEEKKPLQERLVPTISVHQKLISAIPTGGCPKIQLKPHTPVLVIEDSIVDREINAGILKALGFSSVLQAKEGQEGLSIMKTKAEEGNPVGLVLCDWNMPNMSGIEFLKVVRKDKVHYLTPVFLVTGNHDKAHIITSIKSGVTGYVVKPVSADGLKAKVKAFLPKVDGAQNNAPAPAPE